jgi:phosphatidylglycerophosphate synthase
VVNFARPVPPRDFVARICRPHRSGLLFVLMRLFAFLKRLVKADGYLARRFKSETVLGTILDPAADKALVTTLAVTLTMKGLLPRQ